MSSPLSRICQSSRSLLRLLRPRKGILLYLIFIVLSSLFWLSTSLNDYYDCEVGVRVIVNDVPVNYIPLSESTDTVRVMVHDKGYALLPFIRKNVLKPIVIDCPALTNSKCQFSLSASELRKLIVKRLPSSATISSIKPERIDRSYVEGVAKSVPVRVVGKISPASSHYLAHTEIDPAKVTVYAPVDVIDSIQYVSTEFLQLTGFADTVSVTVAIKPATNTKVDPEEVVVALYSDVLTEEETDVPITAVGVPDGTSLRTFPSRVKVRYTVGASMYRTINESQFKVQADFGDIQPGDDKCRISIVETPAGVRNASLATEKVDYLIEN